MTIRTLRDTLAETGERLIPVDTDHFAIRFLVPILTIATTVLVHIVGVLLLDRVMGDDTSPLCIMLPIDVLVLIGAGTGIERVLKRLLPSKRSARLSEDALVLTDARRKPADVRRVALDRAINVNTWHFVIRRRSRVPKGWYCMAMHLLQDETEMIFYTFMSPKDAEALASYDRFVRLRPRQETESNTDLRQVATQRRLLRLEDQRWLNGAEIAPDDFRAVLARIEMLRIDIP